MQIKSMDAVILRPFGIELIKANETDYRPTRRTCLH